MATKILSVKSSLFGDNGVSSQLSEDLIRELRAESPAAEVEIRDLAKSPLPHISAEYMQAVSTEQEKRSEQQQFLADLGDSVIQQVMDADTIIISAPMYNFHIPSTLKAWLDYLARAGVTFRYTENGPEGLVKNKKVFVVTTRGGIYKGTGKDSEVPFLETFLSFLGMTDVEFIYAEGLNMGDNREKGIESAKQQIEQVLAVQ